MTVGSPNPALAAQPVPAPSSDVIDTANNLLGLLGDPARIKEPRALLAKMSAVQKANEAIFKAAGAAIARIANREKDARAAEDRATQARQALADETQEAQQSLSDQGAANEAARERLDERELELEARHQDLAPREASLRRAFKA